jgi:hypothetical protein
MLGVVNADMNIRWDYFVNQYDAVRYVSTADGRDHRHIQFVREFASVVSVLQDKTNSVIDLYKGIYTSCHRGSRDLSVYQWSVVGTAGRDAGCCESSYSMPLWTNLLMSVLDRSLNLEGYATNISKGPCYNVLYTSSKSGVPSSIGLTNHDGDTRVCVSRVR